MAASNAVMRRVALHAILLLSGMAAAVSAGPKPPPVPTPEFQSKAARLATDPGPGDPDLATETTASQANPAESGLTVVRQPC